MEPLISLASSMHAGTGLFALLVGSGISRSAGVPTGWEVVVDLLRRYAALVGEDPEPDPVGWYQQREGRDADYSRLLDELAPSPADRRNLLQPYFEPSPEELEQGTKTPTRAHRAIAELVARGFVRVIVTTNFDRLLEQALVDAGVQPSVISSAAAAVGAVPLAHSRCTLLKVHGDYLSPDLKNTVAELGSYDPAVDALLDQVFDQYGLVVCGWSAEWDAALRGSLLRAPGRRYATFWARVSPLSELARQLVAHRGAVEVPISEADQFFDALAAKLSALTEAMDQRPLSTALAVGELKRYLPAPIHRIRLHDLVMDEIEQLCTAVGPDHLSTGGTSPTAQALAERMRTYEAASARAIALLIHGAFFGDTDQHDDLWVRAVRRVATRRLDQGGFVVWTELQQYPTLLLLYGMGMGSLATGRAAPLARVLAQVSVREPNGDLPVGFAAASWKVLDHDMCKQLPGLANRRTPISDYLFELMREPARPLLADDDEYSTTFDQLEYLLGLVYADHRGEGIGPAGRSAWRGTRDRSGASIMRYQEAWLDAGLFDGSAERLEATRAEYDSAVGRRGLAY